MNVVANEWPPPPRDKGWDWLLMKRHRNPSALLARKQKFGTGCCWIQHGNSSPRAAACRSVNSDLHRTANKKSQLLKKLATGFSV